jgi:hypothetical protein
MQRCIAPFITSLNFCASPDQGVHGLWVAKGRGGVQCGFSTLVVGCELSTGRNQGCHALWAAVPSGQMQSGIVVFALRWTSAPAASSDFRSANVVVFHHWCRNKFIVTKLE